MTLQDALGRLQHHHADGVAKHEPIRDRGNALQRLTDYCTKASGEHNSGEEAGRDARFAKRIAQIGGICLRTLVDLGISDDPPPGG